MKLNTAATFCIYCETFCVTFHYSNGETVGPRRVHRCALFLQIAMIGWLLDLYCRFCNNAIFQNVGTIIILSFIFFSRQFFSAVSWPICTKFGTNVCSYTRFILRRAICEKLKNQVTTAKTLKNRSFFRARRHVFACCGETVKVFLNIFLRLPLGCHAFQKMYLRQFRNQNRLVFSITRLNGA